MSRTDCCPKDPAPKTSVALHSRLDLALFPLWLSAFIPYLRMKSPANSWEEAVVFALLAPLAFLFGLRLRGEPSDRGPRLRTRIVTFGLAIVALCSHSGLAPGLWPLVLLLGLSLLCALVGFSALDRRLRGIEVLAWGTALVALLSLLWWELEPLLQHRSLPSPIAVLEAKALGYEAWNDGRVFGLAKGVETWVLGTSPRYSELFPAILAAALGLFALANRRLAPRTLLLRAVLVLIACDFWRETIVLARALLLSDSSPLAVRQEFALVAYSLAWMPLLLGLGALSRRADGHRYAQGLPTPELLPAWCRGLVLAGSLIAVFGLSFTPAGTPKKGRIAVDGIHSNWEWTDVPLNRQLWGTKTTYSYWSLMVWLRQYFPEVDNVSEGELNDELLSKYDVWILKTPTRAWSVKERTALEAYVAKGGGLWLIGDHTNIFGMNTFLNGVSDIFGIHYNPDAAFDMASKKDKQLWLPPDRQQGATELLDEFLFATSDTLTIDPFRVDPIMVGDRLYADGADYSSVTFFGNSRRDPYEPFGRFVQCAATRHGKGRVVAFADSTCFSSFFMHLPGKPELALGTVNWLNHEERIPAWRQITLALGGLLVGGALIAGALRGRGRGLARLARPAAAGVVLGYGLAGWLLPLAKESVPEAHYALPRVGVVRGSVRNLQERKILGHPEADPHGFLTWYIGFQRSKAIPFVEPDISKIGDYEMAVILEPRRDQIPPLQRYLPDYLRSGGSAWLVCEHPVFINRILEACGVEKAEAPELATWVRSPWQAVLDAKESCGADHKDCSDGQCQPGVPLDEGVGGCVHNKDATFKGHDVVHDRIISLPPHMSSVRGLTPVIEAPAGFEGSVHGSIPVGKGVLYITSAPALLSNQTFGDSTEVPTRERHEVWEVVWKTIDRCLGLREG